MTPSTSLLRALGLVAILTIATGCSPSLRTSQFAFGDNAGVFTNGNLRLVTERHRFQPASGRDLMTVCTEPSPDYAIAFDQSGDISATLTKLGNGDFSFGSHEQTTKLDGRNAGVLALRDGLYAACQSYVNGVIGHDAYALILSQYSELIVELIHEQDVVAADAAKPKADETANPTPAAPAPATPPKADKAALAEQDAASTWTGGATLLIADLPSKTKTTAKEGDESSRRVGGAGQGRSAQIAGSRLFRPPGRLHQRARSDTDRRRKRSTQERDAVAPLLQPFPAAGGERGRARIKRALTAGR